MVYCADLLITITIKNEGDPLHLGQPLFFTYCVSFVLSGDNCCGNLDADLVKL